MSGDILELIEGSRAGDLDAARRLADTVARALEQPDRRIGAALMPKRRGGDPDAGRRAERNQAYADLAVAEFGRVQLTPDQAKRLDRKARRMLGAARRSEGEPNLAQDAIDRIAAAGLGPLSARRLYDVLNGQG